jgi:hypothetical protein
MNPFLGSKTTNQGKTKNKIEIHDYPNMAIRQTWI